MGAFTEALVTGGTSNYIVQTARVQLDMPALYGALSPQAQVFVERLAGGGDGVVDLPRLVAPDWSEDEELLHGFRALPADSRVETLAYCTIPVHEYQHHVDLVQTPFGANAHVTAVREYLAFQSFSETLVQADAVPPGRLVDFEAWAAANHPELGAPWRESWDDLRGHLDLMEVWGDFDHVESARVERTGEPGEHLEIFGHEFQIVLVNDWWRSVTVDDWAPWYVRPGTILEGRAVIASLIWSLRQTRRSEDPTLVAEFLDAVYGDAPHDYRFFIDLAAWWTDSPSMEDLLRKDGRLAAWMLLVMRGLCWTSLHAPPLVEGYEFRNSNVALRFMYAFQHAAAVHEQNGQITAHDLAEGFDESQIARDAQLAPVSDAITMGIVALGGAEDSTGAILNPGIRDHYRGVLATVRTQLEKRVGGTYIWDAGLPRDGNPLTVLWADHPELVRSEEPAPYVERWQELRRRALFRPVAPGALKKLLVELFWVDELQFPCACGARIRLNMSTFLMPSYLVHCAACGVVVNLDAEWIEELRSSTGPAEVKLTTVGRPCRCGGWLRAMVLDRNTEIMLACSDCGAHRRLPEAAWRPILEGRETADYTLGAQLEQSGDLEAAAGAFQRSEAAGDATAAWRLGQVRERQGRIEEAEAAYRRGEAAGRMEAVVALGLLLGSQGDDAGAEAAYRRADLRGDAAAAYNLGLVLDARGERDAAMEAWARAEERGEPDAAFYLGSRREEDGDLAGAEEAYERGDAGGDPNAMVALGNLRFTSGDQDSAKELWERADDLGDPTAAYNLGILMRIRGDFGRAAAAWGRADERGDARAPFLLGGLLHDRGDLVTAEAAWRRAARRGNASALAHIGGLVRDRGDLEEAEALAREGDALGDAAAAELLGELLHDRGADEEAEAAFTRGIERGDPNAAVNLGDLLIKRGDRDGAEAAWRRADAEGHVVGSFNLGLVLADRGDRQGAVEAFERVVDGPDEELAESARAELAKVRGAGGRKRRRGPTRR